jgi:large subunit ribosomal protein L7/L12
MGMPMAMPAAPAGGAPAAAAAAPAAAAEPAKEEFDLKLEGFDAAKKIGVIKEVRALTSLGLKEAKELVEAGGVIKKALKKAEAEDLKKKLEAAGAKIKLE